MEEEGRVSKHQFQILEIYERRISEVSLIIIKKKQQAVS